MAQTFVQTAQLLHQRFPQARFLVPLVSRETRLHFETELWRNGAQELPLTLLCGHAQEAVAAADGVLVASGTATLEVALLKKPMVITYKMSPKSWRIMRHMGYQPWIGLPNILLLVGIFVAIIYGIVKVQQAQREIRAHDGLVECR